MLKKAIMRAIKLHFSENIAFFVVYDYGKYLVVSENLIDEFITTDIAFSIGV